MCRSQTRQRAPATTPLTVPAPSQSSTLTAMTAASLATPTVRPTWHATFKLYFGVFTMLEDCPVFTRLKEFNTLIRDLNSQ